jgi:hypothetical protein
VKEIIFHPEARAEVRESIEFYEARLDGLGLRFLSAVEHAAIEPTSRSFRTSRLQPHPFLDPILGLRNHVIPRIQGGDPASKYTFRYAHCARKDTLPPLFSKVDFSLEVN